MLYDILFSYKNDVNFVKNPFGIRTSSFDSSISLKYFSTPKTDFPNRLLIKYSELKKFRFSFKKLIAEKGICECFNKSLLFKIIFIEPVFIAGSFLTKFFDFSNNSL